MRRLIIFLLSALCLLFVVEELLFVGIKKSKVGEYAKLNAMFVEQNDFENIILGSSRAESHINPEIINALTGINFFNMGLEGEYMPIMQGVLQGYLKNNRAPKRILLNVDLHPYVDKLLVYRFPRFFPYLSNKPLYNSLKKADSRFSFFRYLPFYSLPFFNDKYINASVRGYTGRTSTNDLTYKMGYTPIPNKMHLDLSHEDYTEYESVPEARVYDSFDSIITICKANHIQLSIIYTPIYPKAYRAVKNIADLKLRFNRTAAQNGIRIIDYLQEEEFSNDEYFADPYHLNEAGANKLSNLLGAELNNIESSNALEQ